MTDLKQSNHREYLQAMGIDVWEQRNKNSVDVAQVEVAPKPEPMTSETPLDWTSLQQAVTQCTQCELHQSRTQTVFGVGNPNADLLIIGEAPGADEDRQGEPFVGPAGQLLNEMLKAIQLSRNDVYIANILKCHPPDNRDPKPEEAALCSGFLKNQIELIQPKLIMALGRIVAHRLLDTDISLGKLRGEIHNYAVTNTPLLATYHPAYLLRSPAEKANAWQDLLMAKKFLFAKN